MAQIDLLSKLASTFVGIESAYATLPTMTRAFPCTGSTIDLAQAALTNDDERVRLFNHPLSVQGLKSASAKVKAYLRPDTAQLVAAATPATPWLGVLLKAAMGGEASGAGSTIASAASGSEITVAAGHGSRFKIGTWVAVDVAGTLEAARVINVSTDTLTLRPALSGTPSTSAIVVNSYTYFPTTTNTSSLYLQHAKALDASTHKWALKGGIVGLALSLARGELASAEFDMKFPDWEFPSDDSIAVTAATDPMASPMAVRGATTLVQTPATTTRVHYALHSLDVKPPGDMGMMHIPELGGTEGTTGIMRTGARPFGEVTVKSRADAALHTAYVAQTQQSIVCIVPVGSGTTKRFVIVDMPTAFIKGPPKQTDDGGRLVSEASLDLQEDTTTTTTGLSGSDLDCAVAPIRVSLI